MGEEVELEAVAQRPVADLADAPLPRRAGVRHHDVEPAEGLAHAPEGGLDLVRSGDVAAERQRRAADAPGGLARRRRVAVEATVVITVGSERNNTVTVSIPIGSDVTDSAEAIVSAINGNASMPFLAANTAGVVTLTAVNAGTYGNTIGVEASGTISGQNLSIEAGVTGSVDPIVSATLDAATDRYQTVVWGFPNDIDPLTDFLDARFNADNVVEDGVGVVADIGSASTLAVKYTSFDSQSLVVFGDSASSSVSQSDQIENGTFDSTADWTTGGNWSITGGEAVAAAGSTTLTQTIVSPNLRAGGVYILRYSITAVTPGGRLIPVLGGGEGTPVFAVDDYEDLIVAGNTSSDLVFDADTDSFVGSIDNVALFDLPSLAAGVEQMTNGDFGSPTGWVQTTNFTISANQANAAAGATTLTQTIASGLTEGASYLLKYNLVAITSGSIQTTLGGTAGETVSAPGPHSEFIIAGSANDDLVFDAGTGSYVGILDDVQLFEITSSLVNFSATFRKPSIFELPSAVAGQFGAIRALRLTEGANIADFVSGSPGLDAFGGVALASKPLFNTPLVRLSPADPGSGYTALEIEDLLDAGVSVMGNNLANDTIILGEVVTTFKTDNTFKFLNGVDIASGIREFYFNNFKAIYGQSRLSGGDLVADRPMANQQSILASATEFFVTLSGPGFVLTQLGEEARLIFIANTTVTLDLATGVVTVIMDNVPVVGQLRQILGNITISFSTTG